MGLIQVEKGHFASSGMKSCFQIYVSDDFGKSSCYKSAARDWTSSSGGLGPEHILSSLLSKEETPFSPKWVCGSRWELPLTSWETLNLFSSDLNVGGNIEMHWSVANKAALPAWHSEGGKRVFCTMTTGDLYLELSTNINRLSKTHML